MLGPATHAIFLHNFNCHQMQLVVCTNIDLMSSCLKLQAINKGLFLVGIIIKIFFEMLDKFWADAKINLTQALFTKINNILIV